MSNKAVAADTIHHCTAVTKSGTPCKNYTLPGSDFCRIHQPGQANTSSEEETTTENKDQATPGAQQRRRLVNELEALIKRVQALSPDYQPPAFSPHRLLKLIEQNLDKLSPDLRSGILVKLKDSISSDLFEVDTWKGIWYMLNYSLEHQADLLHRRLTGNYETDEWGLDLEYMNAVRPFLEFMYKAYWRVHVSGLENIPDEGRVLLVCNHSGQLPWDTVMVASSVLFDHQMQRLVRTMYDAWFSTFPFFSSVFTKCGQVVATEENGIRLLEQEQIVAEYPEGYDGAGKLFKNRYRLAHFGRTDFIKMALHTASPIIPVSVIGAEETYISLYKSSAIARLLGFPYFPITPTFPWLGLAGFVPLPSKWYIDFGTPIQMDSYNPAAADDPILVSQLSDQVHDIVQGMIYNRLSQRRSIFFG